MSARDDQPGSLVDGIWKQKPELGAEAGVESRKDQRKEQRAEAPVEPASPCVSVCALDENDICMGCYRSAEEITDWFVADAKSKQAMLERAQARREADNPIRLV